MAAKLVKPDGKQADALEKQIATALTELSSAEEFKGLLNELYFVGAEEYEFAGKKAVVIYVPVPQLRDFQKVHSRLVRELEKKFGGKHVVFVARRKIINKPLRGKNRIMLKQKRPRSRTLTAVHDAILSDLVYPAEVVGKRLRYKLDGKQILKVHLDRSQQTNVEHKVDTFVSLYKHLTRRTVTFEFPEPLF